MKLGLNLLLGSENFDIAVCLVFYFLSFILLWNSYSVRKTVGLDYVVFAFFKFSSTFSAAKRWLENSS